MTQYNCINGQSFTDVCLDTYGTLDLYGKFLNENAISPNDTPLTNQVIVYDATLVKNKILRGRKYSTFTGFSNPEQITPIMSVYKDTIGTSYTATDVAGETVITITALQNNEIVQIEKGILPLKASQFIFNSVAGTITLVDVVLEEAETIFVIYKKTVSV